MTIHHSRRAMLGTVRTGVLSAGAIALLGGVPQAWATQAGATQAGASAANAGDVAILNVALGLEHEAIAAYQIGAESGLLAKPVLDVAVLFQGHHKGHRDALAAAVTQMGGTPVQSKTTAMYVQELDIANTVKGPTDVLKLAQRLEKGAANAYIGVIPSLKDPALAQVAARLAADESSHWTALTLALGEAIPAAPLFFG